MLRDADAREVLRRYPAAVGQARLTSLGNAGGFSGARLWRVEFDNAIGCLKAWPTDSVTPSRLTRIHRLMHTARAAGLLFVPAALAATSGASCMEWAGRIWDLQTWMPGAADVHPSPARIEAACVALARLHLAWAAEAQEGVVCPAARRRLAAHQEWAALNAASWRPTPRGCAAIDALAARAWPLLGKSMPVLTAALALWAERMVVVQPCLCDVWHAHVFYEDERVTGIIDFGSVKPDHVAVDLARLLGSIAGDDPERWATGLRAYGSVRPLAPDDEALAHVLGQTGVLVGLFNWLKWLYRDGREFDNLTAVAGRLSELIERVEGWERRG